MPSSGTRRSASRSAYDAFRRPAYRGGRRELSRNVSGDLSAVIYLGGISAYAERDIDRVLVVQVARRRRRLDRSSLGAAVLSPPEVQRVHLVAHAACPGRW